MGFVESVQTCFSKYVDFSGRATRPEYWWFFLFTTLITLIVGIVGSRIQPVGSIIETIVALALLLPSLAVTARRLHDTDRSAWWLLIHAVILLGWIIWVIALVTSVEEIETWDPERDGFGLIAFLVILLLASLAGWILLLVLCALRGISGPNRYGPDPRQPDLPADGGYGYGYPDTEYPYAPPTDVGGYGNIGGTYNPPDAPAEAGSRQYCGQCGAERQAEAGFCNVCGAGF